MKKAGTEVAKRATKEEVRESGEVRRKKNHSTLEVIQEVQNDRSTNITSRALTDQLQQKSPRKKAESVPQISIQEPKNKKPPVSLAEPG